MKLLLVLGYLITLVSLATPKGYSLWSYPKTRKLRLLQVVSINIIEIG